MPGPAMLALAALCGALQLASGNLMDDMHDKNKMAFIYGMVAEAQEGQGTDNAYWGKRDWDPPSSVRTGSTDDNAYLGKRDWDPPSSVRTGSTDDNAYWGKRDWDLDDFDWDDKRSTDDAGSDAATQTEGSEDTVNAMMNTCLYAITNACVKDTFTLRAVWSIDAFPKLPLQNFNLDCWLLAQFNQCAKPIVTSDARCSTQDQEYYSRLEAKARRVCDVGFVPSYAASKAMESQCYDMSYSNTLQLKSDFAMQMASLCSDQLANQTTPCGWLRVGYVCSVMIQLQKCGLGWFCSQLDNKKDQFAVLCPGEDMLDEASNWYFSGMCAPPTFGGVAAGDAAAGDAAAGDAAAGDAAASGASSDSKKRGFPY